MRNSTRFLRFLLLLLLFVLPHLTKAQFSTQLSGLGSFIAGNPGVGDAPDYTIKSVLGFQPLHPSVGAYNADGTLLCVHNGEVYRTKDGSQAGAFANAELVSVKQWSNIDPNVMYYTTSTKVTKNVLGSGGTTVFDLASASSYFGLNFTKFWGSSIEGSFLLGDDEAIAIFGIVETSAYCLVWKIGSGWLPDKYLMPEPYPVDGWDLYCTTPIGDPKVAGNMGYVFVKPIVQNTPNNVPWGIIEIGSTGAISRTNAKYGWTQHSGHCVWQDSDGTFRPGLVDANGNVMAGDGSYFTVPNSFTTKYHVGWMRGTIYACGDNTTGGAQAVALRKSNQGGYRLLANGTGNGDRFYVGAYAKNGITNIAAKDYSLGKINIRIISYQQPSTVDTIAPTVPTDLTVDSLTPSSFVFSWKASADSFGVTGYKVFNNGIEIGTTTETHYKLASLPPTTTYIISVQARDAAHNWSEVSSGISVTTFENIPPSIPSGLKASDISATGFTLSWTASTDNVGVTGYEVLSNGISLGTTTSTSKNIKDLFSGASYSMTIKAKDAAGNISPASDALPVTTLDTIAPSIPASLNSSQITATGFTLSWAASIDNVSDIVYEVFIDGVPTGTTTSTTLAITGLLSFTEYQLTVKASDSTGNTSVASVPLAVKTKDNVPPSIPEGLSASTITPTSFTLSWTASTDNAGIKVYEVFKNGVSLGTTPSASMIISGLTQGTDYTMNVRARDLSGNLSAVSTALVVTTLDTQAPTIPFGLVASNITGTSFVLSWEPSADNRSVSKYQVFLNWDLAGETADTFLIINNLTVETSYAMTVKASDSAGNISAESDILVVSTVQTSVNKNLLSGISLYPNPASDYLILDGLPTKASVRVLDAMGQTISNVTCINSRLDFNLNGLKAGIYLIHIGDDSRNISIRFIKE